MGSVGLAYPTNLNAGKTARKPSWSIQRETVMFRSHARWWGRLIEEDDEEEGSIAGG